MEVRHSISTHALTLLTIGIFCFIGGLFSLDLLGAQFSSDHLSSVPYMLWLFVPFGLFAVALICLIEGYMDRGEAEFGRIDYIGIGIGIMFFGWGTYVFTLDPAALLGFLAVATLLSGAAILFYFFSWHQKK